MGDQIRLGAGPRNCDVVFAEKTHQLGNVERLASSFQLPNRLANSWVRSGPAGGRVGSVIV
jgi:hypothetical protein